MIKLGLWVRLRAKTNKVQEVATFLRQAVELANQEQATRVWYAVQLEQEEFAIFDAFQTDNDRKAHLNGPIAKALLARANELLAEPPSIEPWQVLAIKGAQ